MTTAMIATFIFCTIGLATAIGGLWLADEAERRNKEGGRNR